MKKFLIAALLLSACSSEKPPVYQGYVEAEYINITPALSGQIESILPKGTVVQKGDIVCIQEAVYENAAVAQAQAKYDAAVAKLNDAEQGSRPEEIEVLKASLKQAEALASFTNAQFNRDSNLYQQSVISEAALQNSRASAEANNATVERLRSELQVAQLAAREGVVQAYDADVQAMHAALRQAEWNSSQKVLKSPVNGTIESHIYNKGEFAPAGTPVLRILAPENIKVRFFVPYEALSQFKTGDTVYLNGITAIISYISPEAEFTPPVIYSKESNQRLSYMLECIPGDLTGLHPGMPVEVSLSQR